MKKILNRLVLCLVCCVSFFWLQTLFNVSAYNNDRFNNFYSSYMEIVNNDFFVDNSQQVNRLIIKSDVDLDRQGAIKYAEGFAGLNIYQYETEEQMLKAYDYYQNLDCVEYVNVDSLVKIATDTESSYESWGANVIGAGGYSNYLLNSSNLSNLPEIVVAVLDTGLDSDHPWFENRVKNEGKNFSSSSSSTNYEYEDVFGHGTHVSGIITDVTMSNVKILPIKVMMDNGYGYLSSVIAGINYVIKLKNEGMNIKIMNLSLGSSNSVGSAAYNAYNDALNNAYDNGILSIVAAGNDGVNVANHTPANVEKAITVSAIGHSGNLFYRPSWSNYGKYVDVSAPGHQIVSAGVGGSTVIMSGTSMAAPHVAGAVALLYSDTSKNYSMQDIENILDDTSIDLGEAGWDSYYGQGMINIEYSYASIIEKVNFSHIDENFTVSFDLTLTSIGGADIYYTVDGTIPSMSNGIKYEKPINIDKTVTVSAIAYVIYDNKVIAYSQVNSITYYFDSNDVDDAFVVNSAGILISYNGVVENLVVPREVNGITITSVGEYAFSSAPVKSVVFPVSVTNIGKYAFAGNSVIEKVSASAVTVIEMYAFYGCSNFLYLTDDYFPELLEIGKYAFAGTYKLSALNLSKLEKIDYSAFYMSNVGNSVLSEVDLINVKIVGDMAFYNCNNIQNIYLPKVEFVGADAFVGNLVINLSLPMVKYIGNQAFYMNKELLSVDFPNVLFIGSNAFYGATKLNAVSMPKVQSIGESAFKNNDSLININMSSVVEIGSYAFDGTLIEELNAPYLKYIGNQAFSNANLKLINIFSVEEIREGAFFNNYSLESVTLSSNIEYIGNDAFNNESATYYIYGGTVAEEFVKNRGFAYVDLSINTSFIYEIIDDEVYLKGYQGESLNILVIPSYIGNLKVVGIRENAFKNYLNITSLNVAYLRIIEENAFYGCKNLKTVNLERIQIIEDKAFENCTELYDVNIENAEYIGNNTFYSCDSLTSVRLLENIAFIGSKAFGYTSLGQIGSWFVIYGYDGTIAKEYADSRGIEFRAIFRNIDYFYYNTYVNNGKIEIYISFVDSYIVGDIIIPDSYNDMVISKIGSEAFKNCAFITGIKLPSSITIIGAGAFYGCNNLKSINLDYIKVIEEGTYGAFEECDNLEYVNLPLIENVPSSTFKNCNRLTEINIPNVKIIGEAAFYECFSLKVVKSPLVEEIGWAAFCYDNNLEYIDTFNLKVLGTVKSSEEISGAVFTSVNKIERFYLPNIQIIGDSTFDSEVKHVIIGKKIENIGYIPIPSTVTIYGYSNTLIEEYARQNGNEFVLLDEIGITRNLDVNKEVEQYETVYLIFEASGFEIEYQWYLTKTTIDKGVKIEGAISNIFSIDTSTIGNFKYYVIATNWDGEIVTSNLCDISVIEDDGVYNIVASVVGEGTISNSSNNIIYRGQSLHFSFTPNEGYYVKNIMVDGLSLNSEKFIDAVANGYTFENVQRNHSIVVTYDILKFVINVIQADNGVISAAEESYDYGSNASFTVKANEGYHIECLLIDGYESCDNLDSYVFVNIVGNHELSAIFSPNSDTRYTVYHYQESLDSSGDVQVNGKYYNLIYKDISRMGTTGELTNVLSSSYIGFTALNIQQTVILGNGSSIVNVFYNRNLYSLILSKDEGVSSVSGAGSYKYGETVIIKAVLVEGYDWYMWESSNVSLCSNGLSKEYKIIVPASTISLVAKSKIKQYQVNISSKGNGKVSSSADKIVNYGESITLEFTTSIENKVSSLLINGVENSLLIKDNLYVISNVNKNYEIEVSFGIKIFDITVNKTGNGLVLPSEKKSVNYGGSQSFEFYPSGGYYLSSISVDGNFLSKKELQLVKENGYTFSNIVENHIIDVVYTKNEYLIYVDYNENGNVYKSGDNSVGRGENKHYEFVAMDGYFVKSVYVDGYDIGSVAFYTFENVVENHSLEVVFDVVSYEVHFETSCDEVVTYHGVSHVQYGGNISYKIEPAAGYFVKDIKVNGESIGVVNIYSLTNIKSDYYISVECESIIFEINVEYDENGSVSPSNKVYVKYGTSESFKITPNENYGISYIKLNGKEVTIDSVITIDNVLENQILEVGFDREFIITAISDENGSITPSIAVIKGNEQRFDFYPKDGYKIKKVEIDGVNLGEISHYIFYDVSAEHSISVEYEIKKYNIVLNIKGSGEVESDDGLLSVNHGDSRILNVENKFGWKVSKVIINNEELKVENGKIVISNITDNINIEVIFIIDSDLIRTIVIIVASVIIGVCILIIILKKYELTGKEK